MRIAGNICIHGFLRVHDDTLESYATAYRPSQSFPETMNSKQNKGNAPKAL